MKLKYIIEAFTNTVQPSGDMAVKLDVGDVLQQFKDKVEEHTAKEKAQTEQSLLQKLKGKTVTLRASKGYKQAQKDYTINIKDVNIEWHYEDYFIVLVDQRNDNYFIIDGFPLKVQNSINGPVTSAVQNTSQNDPNSLNKIKQF
jgi:hypothetical protein